jgi:hypothetical protein
MSTEKGFTGGTCIVELIEIKVKSEKVNIVRYFLEKKIV